MPLPENVTMTKGGNSLVALRGTATPVFTHFASRAPRSRLVLDVENGGFARVFGTTKVKGTSSNVPIYAKVHLLRQVDKKHVRTTWSNAATGAFEFVGVDARQKYLVLAEDSTGSFRPVAIDGALVLYPKDSDGALVMFQGIPRWSDLIAGNGVIAARTTVTDTEHDGGVTLLGGETPVGDDSPLLYAGSKVQLGAVALT